MILNSKVKGDTLFEIDFTPKGTASRQLLHVWAKNRLAASNYLILNHIFGTQHSIRCHSSGLLK